MTTSIDEKRNQQNGHSGLDISLETLQAENQRLQASLNQRDREIQQIKASAQYYKNRYTWRKQLDAISNKKLTGNEKLVINALQEEYFTNPHKKPDDRGDYRIYISNATVIDKSGHSKELKGLASYTGLTPDVFGETLKKLHAKGIIVRIEVPPDKYKAARKIYVRPTDLFSIEGFQSLFDGDWGGNREQFKCKACGGKRCQVQVETTITRTCTNCGYIEEPEHKTHTYTIEPEPGEDESQDIEQTEIASQRSSHEYSEFDHPYVGDQNESPLDEHEQARTQRVEREKGLHKMGIELQLEKRGLTKEDVRFTENKNVAIPPQFQTDEAQALLSKVEVLTHELDDSSARETDNFPARETMEETPVSESTPIQLNPTGTIPHCKHMRCLIGPNRTERRLGNSLWCPVHQGYIDWNGRPL